MSAKYLHRDIITIPGFGSPLNFDCFVKSHIQPLFVIPLLHVLDSRLRGNDKCGYFSRGHQP